MSDHLSDSHLDAQLRDVPLGEDFLDRLKAGLVPCDDTLDRMLRSVHVPSTLASRLHEIPDDAVLDERIADLPQPMTLMQRLYEIPRERIAAYRRRSPARRAVEAAGLFVSASVALAAAVALVITGTYPFGGSELQIGESRPTVSPPTIVMESAEPSATIDGDLPADPSIDSSEATAAASRWVNLDNPGAALTIDDATSDPRMDDTDSLDDTPTGELAAIERSGADMMDDIVRMRFGVLGSPQTIDDLLPELEAPWVPRARGIEPPLVRGYDRVFFLKNRVSPPIPPGANEVLETLVAPLSVDTSTFRLARQRIRQQRLPEANEVRVEDFLAAIDYRFPSAPTGELALRTTSGPSPFGPSGAGLLQVGVQAGSVKRDSKDSTHLVLALDASASMGRKGRWREAIYAIERLLGQLTATDHLSLVVFHEGSIQRWEDIRSSEAAEVIEQLKQLAPSGGANLPVGLREAVSTALSQESARAQRRRIVLLTDDPSAIRADQQEIVREMLLSADEAGAGFDVVDLGDVDRPELLVAQLASELDGDFRRLSDGRAVYWLLLDRLTGQSSVVASDARLSIRFNPKAVAAYRLIGHEANALAGVSPPAVELEMHAGDAATALVEVWLQPGDVDDVAQATVTWTDPKTGEQRKRTQRISRLQFATSFAESAPSLQAAAIAAESAELLRGSREALRTANPSLAKPSWDAILAAAREANPALDRWDDFRDLLRLAEQARQLRP